MRQAEEARGTAIAAAAGFARDGRRAADAGSGRRDAGPCAVVDCNAAYAAALDLPREGVLSQASEARP